METKSADILLCDYLIARLMAERFNLQILKMQEDRALQLLLENLPTEYPDNLKEAITTQDWTHAATLMRRRIYSQSIGSAPEK